MQSVPTMPLPRAARVLDRVAVLALAPLALPFALALAPLTGCSAAPRPAAPETPAAAEPAAAPAAPMPAVAPAEEQAPADADDALAQLERAEAELRGVIGPARDRASKTPATPSPTSAPRTAPAGDAAPVAQGAEMAGAGGDPCAIACRALGSMRRAADHLCGLAGEQDGRCTSARGRVRGADAEVRQTCPQCAP